MVRLLLEFEVVFLLRFDQTGRRDIELGHRLIHLSKLIPITGQDQVVHARRRHEVVLYESDLLRGDDPEASDSLSDVAEDIQ